MSKNDLKNDKSKIQDNHSSEETNETILEKEDKTLDTLEGLQEKIKSLETESLFNLEGWKRAQADYQNLQKNSAKEKIEIIKYASTGLIENLIPLFDNFELALKYTPEELKNNQWVNGIEFILKQMKDILIDQGVSIINPLGEDFNPYEHEAVEMVEMEAENEKNKVIEVLQVGYKIEQKLIRSARVKVSS